MSRSLFNDTLSVANSERKEKMDDNNNLTNRLSPNASQWGCFPLKGQRSQFISRIMNIFIPNASSIAAFLRHN